MAFNNEIEEVKAQIKVLEKKLSLLKDLKELEKTKSPVEEAYKRWMGDYPPITPSVDGIDDIRWRAFQMGYNAAYEEKVVEEQEVREWDVVRESVKWCEEHPGKDPLDWLKPQTPEQVADGLKEAFREAVKQGVVSSVDKPPTLRDVCMDWWDRVFGDTDDTETCIDNLVDEISLWLPKYQSAAGSQNAYVECTVEGFNDCLDKIKNKLR